MRALLHGEMLNETEETVDFVIFLSLTAFYLGDPAPSWLRLWVSFLKVVWTGLAERFLSYIGIRVRKPPQKLGVKEVAFNSYRKKYFTRLYISRCPFIPANPLLATMSCFFFRFSSKIPSAHFLNGITPKKKAASDVLLRRTNYATKTAVYS